MSPLVIHSESTSKNQRNHVLIVEDERVARRALAALMTASGYRTAAAGSAEEALDAVKGKGVCPDIALVDLDLPGMNGLELIGQLTRMEPGVFTVLITSANGDKLTELLHERGVAYLRKPLDFNRLLSLLPGNTPN